MSTGAEVMTTIHLVLIAILAVLTVVGIAWGIRLRQRNRASRKAREEQAVALPAATEAAPTVAPARASEPLVAPASVTDPLPVRDGTSDEPIAAAAAMDASPAAEATASGAATDAGPAAQPVTILKGLGPKIAGRLAERGITTVGDMAALTPAAAAALDAELGTFAGRLARDRWVEQATLLAAGDRAGFEAAFGKL